MLLAAVLPAGAQSSSETGVITITVVEAATKNPLLDARVTLFGATTASALTTRSGIVKYTDVPSGLYRVRVTKAGFQGSTSTQFEVLGNKEVDVDVNLGPSKGINVPAPTSTAGDASGPKIIGRVSAKVTINTRDVDENSSIRKISDSLTEALGKIAGVDVTQDSNDPNAPQTISLRGKDESQTAVTLDGIPISAPGAATNLRAINTDLFSGAGANFSPQAGALGGSLNFRTLQPTQTWVSRLSASYGTFDRFNYQLGETGSIGKLGIAALHTYRGGNNPLTFETYRDQSGLTYPHAGESTNAGNLAKLRYSLNDRTTLNLTAIQNDQGTSVLCTQDVTLLPCGIGPGNTSDGKFQFMYGSVQSLIGETSMSITGYASANSQYTNDALRYVNGGFNPFVSTTKSNSRGVAFASTLTKGKHTFTLSGSTYASITSFQPVVNGSRFVVASQSNTASQSYQIADSFKVNDRLTLGANASAASTSGSGSSFIGGVSAQWRPQSADSFKASVSVGSSQPANGLLRTFSDPAGARFNCFAGTANVSGPGDQPGHQSAVNYDVAWSHQWRTGSFTINTYRQTQTGQLVNAQINAASLGLSAGDPYIAALQGYYASPFVCGTNAVLSPSGVYVSEAIGGTTRVYQGFDVSGRIGLGPHIVVLPSYSTTSAVVAAADARLAGLSSTTIVGAQIPGRPVHRGNLTIDANLPRSGFELLANASFTGANNAQHLDPYVLVNAGISHQAGIGRLTFFASNLFNTESGALSSMAFAQPIATSGGGQLLVAANPNQPRAFNLTYSFNTGAVRGAGAARNAVAAGSNAQQQRGRGLGAFTPYPPPTGADPLGVATARDSCKPEDATVAAIALDQLKAAAAAFKAGQKTLPAVEGLKLVPHGDPTTDGWYFEIRPQLPDGARFGAQQQRAGRRTGPPGEADATPSHEFRSAIARFRSVLGCAYFSVLTQPEAKAKGYAVFTGRNGLGYAPQIGLFAVRAPELGTGGGSLKQ